ncbi:related to Mig1 protein [Ustilago sp. UG-2017a]|nr:related to Mig1 protein [Ustilago sp. UG-2017a]
MTRPLQCLTSLMVLALVLGQSAHCAVVKQSSVPGSKTPLYKESAKSIDGYCGVTPLFVDKAGYDKRCDEKSNSKWPCFKTSYDASLKLTTIEPWLEPFNMSEEILLMDETATAFTLRDASVSFIIKFPNSGDSLKYYDYDDKTGCYKIHLQGEGFSRIFVSDGNGDDRDIDTLNYRGTGKLLCSKWITIGFHDTDDVIDPADSDNRGI